MCVKSNELCPIVVDPGVTNLNLEQDSRHIAINPDRLDKLITALGTAVDNDSVLDKEATSYNAIFDAYRY